MLCREAKSFYLDHRLASMAHRSCRPAISRTASYAARTFMSSLFEVGGGMGSPASRRASIWSLMPSRISLVLLGASHQPRSREGPEHTRHSLYRPFQLQLGIPRRCTYSRFRPACLRILLSVPIGTSMPSFPAIDRTWPNGMLKLAVATLRPNVVPPILLDKSNCLSDLHVTVPPRLLAQRPN